MTHKKICPNCKSAIGGGHGIPLKHLDSPIKICPYCNNNYIDENVLEWSVSPIYRKVGYFFANNRFWICLYPSIFAGIAIESLLAFVACFISIFLLCCLYVTIQIKFEKDNSKKRTSNPQYVELLEKSGYPIKENKSSIPETGEDDADLIKKIFLVFGIIAVALIIILGFLL